MIDLIDYQPEPLSSLQERFPAAFVRIFDIDEIVQRNAEGPGRMRSQVFDCEDGMRILMSLQTYRPLGLYFHMSASYQPGTQHYLDVVSGEMLLSIFLMRAEERFRSISGLLDIPLDYMGISPGKGIPHWFIRDRRLIETLHETRSRA